jgi:hypothetical protein
LKALIGGAGPRLEEEPQPGAVSPDSQSVVGRKRKRDSSGSQRTPKSHEAEVVETEAGSASHHNLQGIFVAQLQAIVGAETCLLRRGLEESNTRQHLDKNRRLTQAARLLFPKYAGDDIFLDVEVPAHFRNDILTAKRTSEMELRQILGDFVFEGMQGSICRTEEMGRVTWGNSAALRFLPVEESTDVVVRFALSLEVGTELVDALQENERDLGLD